MTWLNTFKTSDFMRRWFIVASLALLCACANVGAGVFEHGISPEVKGTQAINDIQVIYGAEVINFKGIRPPGSGGGWNAPMPIPDKMTVRWSISGQPQEVIVNLVGKTVPTNRLAKWRLRFFGEKLEVWRDDDDPGSPYYFKPAVQVYP